MTNQIIPKLITGTAPIIAKRTDSSRDYVGRVLAGKVKPNGKKAKAIIKVANEINNLLTNNN